MSLRDAFGTNKQLEQDGVWLEVFDNDDGTTASFLVRRVGSSNKKYQARVAKESKKKGRRGRSLSDEQQEAIIRKSFIATCLVDWKNVEDIREGAAETYMPFNHENAEMLFKELPDLYEHIVNQAIDMETYKTQSNEDTAGNLPPT